MYLHHNIDNDFVIPIDKIYERNQLVRLLKNRFYHYGYKEIDTPTLESYDMYSELNGTVNRQEMIKTIDNTGQVRVLRPDITIPITRKIAQQHKQLTKDLRYFYVHNVFRHALETKEQLENKQAGVEYFGNSSVEADAEIIALAYEVLDHLQVNHFKIEIGHAGFFKQLVKEMQLEKHDLNRLKNSIRAKNVGEIDEILSKLHIDDSLKSVVTTLPFLYGNYEDVIQKANGLPLSDTLKETLQNINTLFTILDDDSVIENIVIDLSLINHMDYYSAIIFQGFIEKIGKPVLMGGRYDQLANQFSANIPAIGFAFNVDLLMKGIPTSFFQQKPQIDVCIYYDEPMQKLSFLSAKKLRNSDFTVVTYPEKEQQRNRVDAMAMLHIKKGEFLLTIQGQKTNYPNLDDVISTLKNRER